MVLRYCGLIPIGVLLSLGFEAECAYGQANDSIRGSALMAPRPVAKLLDPYRGPLDSTDVAESLKSWWSDADATVGPDEHVLAARLWWRAGRGALALAELDEIGPRESGPLDLLERARIMLESDSSRAAGVRAWWASCTSIDERTRTEVFWDILPLTTPEERAAWPRLLPGKMTCGWLRDFWNQRAQRMAVPVDERLALHYRRLAHAHEWYWIPRPYFQKGTSDYHGRPEGLAMDDRGLIFVRMGPPLTDEGFPATTVEAAAGSDALSTDGAESSDSQLGFTSGDTRRCWPYWRPGGYRIFCFYDGRLGGLVPGAPGTRWFQKYVANSNLPETVVRHRVSSPSIPGGGLRDRWERALDRVENRAWERHGVVRTRENIEEALERIPDVPEVLANVRVQIETLRFLNPSRGEWQIWTLASARAGDLTAATDADGKTLLQVGGRYALLDTAGVQLNEFARVEVDGSAIDEDAGIGLKGVFAARPGRLPLTVVVDDLNEPKAGNWVNDTVNVPRIGGLPQLSDIAVAQSEGGTWTRDGETYLNVSPAHVTNPDGSIHTYFEVYGVDAGTHYDVEFRMVPSEAAERIWRIDPGDLAFRLQFSAQMSGDIGRHHLRLDLSDTKPGAYVLAVRIQDEKTKAYSLPSVTDVFVPKH